MNRYKHDDPAQRFLREVVHPEIAAVLQKHNCGAVVITCSKQAAAWITVLPDWGALRPDPNPAGMRFTAKRDDPDQHEKLELGLHFLKAVKFVCNDINNFYGRFWRQVTGHLKAQGVEVTEGYVNHFGEITGYRPDPLGGKVD